MADRPQKVVVNDKMQHGYEYMLSEPMGRNFHPLFKPSLTPKQMLRLGVFGGVYMRDCRKEFPEDWFVGAKLAKGSKDPGLNYFNVDASLSLAEWMRRGWIRAQDPRGWFQWYCRYYMGRRSEDDMRQIKRWRAIGRHVAAVKKNCSGDLNCRPKQRQAILHWAIDSRKI